MARRKSPVPRFPTPEEIERKIDASKDLWFERTKKGFNEYWFTWYNMVYPSLVDRVLSLPPKTDNIDANIDRRVKPIARLMHDLAPRYRRLRAQYEKMKAQEKASAVTTPPPIPVPA